MADAAAPGSEKVRGCARVGTALRSPSRRAMRLADLHSGARWQPFQTQLGL